MIRNTILTPILICMAMHALAQPYRMIARSNSHYSEVSSQFEPVDTAHYNWYDGRGGYNFQSVYHSSVVANHMDSWEYKNNTLQDDERITRTFDAHNNVLTVVYDTWSPNNNYWKKTSKTGYTYDQQDHITETVYMKGDANNTGYVNSSRTVNTYDLNGDLTTSIYYQWVNNAWLEKDQTLYTYNAIHGITSKIQATYDGNSWINQNKYTYTLNAGNYVTLEQHFDWNNGWKIDGQHLYTYDGNNNLTEEVYQSRSNNMWLNENRRLQTFNNNNLVTTWIYQDWENNAWKNLFRSLYTYDVNGNELYELVQAWIINTWNTDNRMARVYNSANLCTQFTREFWNGNAYVYTNGSERSNYYYEQYTPAGVAKTGMDANILLYPVPANSFVTVAVNMKNPTAFKLMIYDMQGRMVMQWNETATAGYKRTIPTGELPAGNYVAIIAQGEEQVARQFNVVH